MYLYEKDNNKINIYEMLPNMKEVIKAREKEVYSRLYYLDIKRAISGYVFTETSMDSSTGELLLNIKDEYELGRKVNSQMQEEGFFHNLVLDKSVNEDEAFALLNKVIHTPVLKYVVYVTGDYYNYCCLTKPVYENLVINNVTSNKLLRKDKTRIIQKVMTGIVPTSKKMYDINHLSEILYNGEVEDLFKGNPRFFLENNPELVTINKIEAPDMLCSTLEDFYRYGIMPGYYEEFLKRLELSNDILKRVRSK